MAIYFIFHYFYVFFLHSKMKNEEILSSIDFLLKTSSLYYYILDIICLFTNFLATYPYQLPPPPPPEPPPERLLPPENPPPLWLLEALKFSSDIFSYALLYSLDNDLVKSE